MSVGLSAMKQPFAVVTRTCTRLHPEPYRARRGDFSPSLIRPSGPFEVASAINVRACDGVLLCGSARPPRAFVDRPSPAEGARVLSPL